MDLNSNFYEIKKPMLKILVTYAVQGEFVELKWPDIEPYYIRTGIGKVKSAFHLRYSYTSASTLSSER